MTGSRNSPWERNARGKQLPVPRNTLAKHLPVRPKEVVNDVGKVISSGATMVHLHARNPDTGIPFTGETWYQDVIGMIREMYPDVAVSATSSRQSGIRDEMNEAKRKLGDNATANDLFNIELLRIKGLDAKPDLFTIVTASDLGIAPGVVIPGEASGQKWRQVEHMQRYYKHLRE